LSKANEEALRLHEVFGLTPTETKVVETLLAGRTVSETAADLGVAFSTGKTHLTSICAKTGVSRQVELVRLAARLGRPV
jgi:DNA-binding CsgD family transcriptional regulator